MAWDPAQYLKFADHRLRPAVDLLNRVDLDDPGDIYDLGAGAGNVTRLIKERWPDARVTGVDDSQAMLAKAAATAPSITWRQADLATWRPAQPADLIYSNAALHWLPGHERLFPPLLAGLAPGGVLAVQMPRNFGARSHTAIAEAALAGPWRATLEKEWTKGTWLKPLLDALAEPERGRFEAAYAALVARAYPRRSDGRTLFPFRRLFIVARAR